MSKLSKAAKTDLINKSVTVLFLDKFKELDEKTSSLIAEILNSHAPYVSAKQKISDLSKEERATIYLGHNYRVCEIDSHSIYAKYCYNGKQIRISERSYHYPRTTSGTETLAYRVESDSFCADHGRLSVLKGSAYAENAIALRDEYKELFSLISDVEKVVMSASTAKQLQELSPALYDMLPKTAVSTALILAESLCRVNEMLAGK